MKLTPENMDDMDCRPGGRPTGINYVPPWVKKAIAEAERKAVEKEKSETANRETAADPTAAPINRRGTA